MSDELLMDLADASRPEDIVAVILRHHGDLQPPVPIEALAGTVGITDIAELTTQGFVGALMTNEAKTDGVILVRKGERSTRRRFTIGHELGHFLIRSHRGNRHCTAADLREMRRDTEHRRQEAEANRFAAGLLMPRQWFERDMGRLGSVDVTHIQQLSERYCTSFEATANRYLELTDEACAVVFSTDGAIRYARPSLDFPPLCVSKGDSVPYGSASYAAPGQPLRAPTEWTEVNGAIWLRTERGVRIPTVLEQSMRQKGGHQVTLLYTESRDEEEEDAETDLEESYSVRFRR